MIERMVGSLKSASDLELFALKLRGLYSRDIASASGTTTGAVRKRWARLRSELRRRFANPAHTWRAGSRGPITRSRHG